MQLPIHILAGFIVGKTFDRVSVKWIGILMMLFTSILLHGIFDKLGNLTYSPSQADFSNPFWLGYHFVNILVSITFLYLYWSQAKWGILFSVAPDVEWIFVRVQEIFHLNFGFYNQPYLHDGIGHFLDSVPPFYFLNLLPDFRADEWAVLVEIFFIAMLLLTINYINTSRRNIHFN
jgi:hypothetical protein